MIDPLMQQQTETVRACLLRAMLDDPWAGDKDEYRNLLFDARQALDEIVAQLAGTGTLLLAAHKLNDRAKVDLPEWYANDGDDASPEYMYFIELDDALAELRNLAAMREWAERKQGEPESGGDTA